LRANPQSKNWTSAGKHAGVILFIGVIATTGVTRFIGAIAITTGTGDLGGTAVGGDNSS
jgi:hypothetical protein